MQCKVAFKEQLNSLNLRLHVIRISADISKLDFYKLGI